MVTIKTKNHKIETRGASVLKRVGLSALLVIVFLITSWGPTSEEGIRGTSEKISGVINKFECEDIFGKVGHLYTFQAESGRKYQWRTGGMKVACKDVSGLTGKNFVAHVRFGDRPVEIIVEGRSVLPITKHVGDEIAYYLVVSVLIVFLVFIWNFRSYATIKEKDQ